IARIVKIADLSHNLVAFRLPIRKITEKDFVRWNKYHRALVFLTEIEGVSSVAGLSNSGGGGRFHLDRSAHDPKRRPTPLMDNRPDGDGRCRIDCDLCYFGSLDKCPNRITQPNRLDNTVE